MAINITRIREKLISKLPASFIYEVVKTAGPGSYLFPLATRLRGYRAEQNPKTVTAPKAPTRVLIAPFNIAGQGWELARALEANLSDVAAHAMTVDFGGVFSFNADSKVTYGTYALSKEWAKKHFEQVCGFTHVLIEAENSLFGRLFNFDVRREVRALQERGIAVAFLSHGSDTRSPSGHANRHEWSPFANTNQQTVLLQRKADANRELIESLGIPTFVTTPDLLDDLPNAHWCPLVVKPEQWTTRQAAPTVHQPLRVAHIPSRQWLKGTEYIRPVFDELSGSGLIEPKLLEGIPRTAMPKVLSGLDVLVEQLTLGSYGVTALEAICSGCLAVANVSPHVREVIKQQTGIESAIVQADPDTLVEVLKSLADDSMRENLLKVQKEYVAKVHTGTMSAKVLETEWLKRR
ncbi:MAG: hypothetical protein E6121_00750 [Varibaculum cambriense]|uniref:hypothetical protein n=1 Tax=Varibaculum cambriense TaxID=184870 RepID=UPI002911A56D|nr:hypothetical protein [Varibaculum cambriense]MDU5315666.1 hypothetical protein [Varibaculum cambriense]MDU7408135.1 hypothetical protein [Varibaculum cambriense]